jgi:hypothetical protein
MAPLKPDTTHTHCAHNNNRLKYQQSKDYLALLLSTSTNVINLQREIQLLLDKQQVTSYQGLVPSEWVVWICVFVCLSVWAW